MGQLLIHVQSILLDLPRGEKVVIEWEPDDGS